MPQKISFRMKKYLFSVAMLFGAFSFANEKGLDPNDKYRYLMKNFIYNAMNFHYNGVNLDETYSKNIFHTYMEYLDGQKRYFLQSDIDEFKKYEEKLADDLLSTDPSFFNLTYERMMKRLAQAENNFKKIIKKPFRFSQNEFYDLDFENLPYEKTEEALKKRWELILKYSFLTNYTEKATEEAKKKEKNASYKPKSKKVLEKEAREMTKNIFNEWFLSLKEMPKDEWFAVFLNSYAEALDPHSNYLAPNLRQEFEDSSSGKFEGIGAGLKKTTEGVEITDIPAGSPAWKTNALQVGDLIIAVGEGTQKPINIVGMRMQEVTRRIKGNKGTEVRLTIKRKDGTEVVVPIIRDVISVEETFAKTSLIKQNGKTFGLIHLPKFYINPNNHNERNAAWDMAMEITKLNKLNVDGLIIDLRDNSGGSFKTVVEIAGYFIKEGPIVQVRANNAVQIYKDPDPEIRFEKPLVILVNENSASASELFSGAMQDYKRAIIIGGRQTHGKGTSQVVFHMNEFQPEEEENKFNSGGLKLTVQKFYRINGTSNQLDGVKSDIQIPNSQMYLEVGERKMRNPLPNDAIKVSNYTPLQVDYTPIISKSQARIASSEKFKIVEENAKWQKQKKDRKSIRLTIEEFAKNQQLEDQHSQNLRTLSKTPTGVQFTAMPQEAEEMLTNEDLKIRRQRWFETLQNDLYVEEAVKVLTDMQK